MKKIHKLLLLLACLLLAGTTFLSCELDSSDDPEHPLYVSYSISGNDVSFTGPDQVLKDVKAWYKANSIIYDTQVNYSSGKVEEFVESDTEAVNKYENVFMPKFRAFLTELRGKLANGSYGSGVQVKMTLSTYASRAQGEQGTLKYEQTEFYYPTANE